MPMAKTDIIPPTVFNESPFSAGRLRNWRGIPGLLSIAFLS